MLKAAKRQDQGIGEQRKADSKRSKIFALVLRYVRLLGLFGG